MSINIDYFFNSEKDFEQLTAEIEKWIGCKFQIEEGKNHSSTLFGMPINFGIDHGMENDGILNFEDYKYSIGITNYWGSADLRDTQISIMALIANLLYRRIEVKEGILVYDVQRLLAKYSEKIDSNDEKNLFDEVSDCFVEFPKHLIDLYKKL